MCHMNYRLVAEQIFLAGIESVLPDRLINRAIVLREDILHIGKSIFRLDHINHIYVIGAGKASAMMGAEVEKILGERITDGHIVLKYGHTVQLNKITVSEAAHPIPDSNGFEAAKKILCIAKRAGKNDLVISWM